MGSEVAVCRVEEVAEGRGRMFRVGSEDLAIFNDGGRFFAIADRCPHAGASLGSGWIEAGAVTCPLHYWRFRLSDGRCLAGGGDSVSAYAVEVREGRVWVAV